MSDEDHITRSNNQHIYLSMYDVCELIKSLIIFPMYNTCVLKYCTRNYPYQMLLRSVSNASVDYVLWVISYWDSRTKEHTFNLNKITFCFKGIRKGNRII